MWRRKSSLCVKSLDSSSEDKKSYKKYSVSLEQLNSAQFLDDPRYVYTSRLNSDRDRGDSIEIYPVELKPNNKKKSITRKGSSIFSRSASLLGLRSLFRKPSTVRMESIADNLKATPSEEELEKEVVEKERSQTWLQQPTYSFCNSRSTNASMLTLDLNGQQKSKVDKYNTPYEDLVAGKCEPADPQRLERFLDADDCLEILGIPKIWIRMIKPRELEIRKTRALLTANQYRLNTACFSSAQNF